MNIDLATDCLACLSEEQAYLTKLCETLNDVRKSLLSEEFKAVDSVLSQIPKFPPDELQKRYARITQSLAEHFGLPAEQISLDHLAAYVNQHAQQDVWEAIHGIRQLRRKAAMLNRSNLAVAGVLSRVVDRFIRHVTGVDSNPTYSRTGTVEVAQPAYQIQRSA